MYCESVGCNKLFRQPFTLHCVPLWRKAIATDTAAIKCSLPIATPTLQQNHLVDPVHGANAI